MKYPSNHLKDRLERMELVKIIVNHTAMLLQRQEMKIINLKSLHHSEI